MKGIKGTVTPNRICPRCGGPKAFYARACRRCVASLGEDWHDSPSVIRRKAQLAAYRLANRDAIKQQGASWRSANKARLRLRDAALYQKNRAARDQRTRAWVAAHPEQRAEHNKASKKRNPEAGKDYKKRRKARLRGAAVIERFKASEIYERDGWVCGICDRKIAKGEESIDHIIPVSKGGPHTRANVRAAHYVCNRNRGNRS